MRVVVQRVISAHVEVGQKVIGHIEKGFLLYIGIYHGDEDYIVERMVDKISNLRVFEDDYGRMNLNITQVGGDILCVPQFTLYADTKGNRPSFTLVAEPTRAEFLYQKLVKTLKFNHHVEEGAFGAHMRITSVNDGPVTILLDM
ncbi:MAG: D-tyrosyl-tRNA(Tyr) deacylase [Acholeplasmataceae bacterium]|nr:D-tyrosyl-tRNA(Tyr) deacylase [Acholeplasmataceae bacterium]